MRVIFTGNGPKTGTWRMRANEMASTRSTWEAIPQVDKQQLKNVEAVVLVKRIPRLLVERIHAWGGPFFYDALDFWRQSMDDPFIKSRTDIQRIFQKYFDRCSPDVILCTNKLMAKDLKIFGIKTTTHYHHYEPSLIVTKKQVSNEILYWGRRRYLGEWWDEMNEVCYRLDKRFVLFSGTSRLKPYQYNTNVMFAVRGGEYGTWLARRWKSGIKGIIAERLGIPYVAMPEQSYIEQASKNLFVFNNKEELKEAVIRAFDATDNPQIKKPCTKYSLENCANELEKTIGKYCAR